MIRVSYLVPEVDIGLFGDEQGHHVGPPFLRGQVERRDSLQRLSIGRSAVLQQAVSHLHLVLLGCYVEGGVAVLEHRHELQSEKI